MTAPRPQLVIISTMQKMMTVFHWRASSRDGARFAMGEMRSFLKGNAPERHR